MKRMDLFDELTYIDDDLILEAHETPVARQHHFDPRRFGVLLAAVISLLAMSVGAMAVMTENLDSRLSRLWEKYLTEGYSGYYGYEDNNWIEMRRELELLDDREVELGHVCVYSLHHAQVRAFSEGKTIEVKLEAMVLMENGQIKYKSRTIQGEGEVNVSLDNLIAGEPGTIVHIRRTTALLGDGGWETYRPWNTYIASQFGYQVSVGIDTRFPDMRYNYDGRVTAGSSGEQSEFRSENPADGLLWQAS